MSGQKIMAESAQGISRKGGCLWLMLAGVLFIVLVFSIIIYVISRPQTIDIQRQEQVAIENCWHNAESKTINPVSKAITEESCKEMKKQFEIKYAQPK